MKKIMSLLIFAALFLQIIPVAAESEAVIVPEKGYVVVEAEKFVTTTTPAAYYESQGDYKSGFSEIPNTGCMAVSGNNTTTYLIDVKKDGSYNFSFYKEDTSKTKTFTVQRDGETLGSVTANYQKESTTVRTGDVTVLSNVPLKAGLQTITLVTYDQQLSFFYYFTIEAVPEGTSLTKKEGFYRQAELPAKIQAEDYDLGAEGSHSADGVNGGGAYRINDPIDIFKKDDMFYVSLAKGEYVKYTFEVPVSGIYNLSAAVQQGSKASFWFDECEVPISLRLAGGSDFPEAPVAGIWLNKGTHTVKVASETSTITLDYLRFAKGSGDYITLDELAEKEEVTVEEGRIYRELYVSESGNDENTGDEKSPFATIGRAKDEIAAIGDKMDGDIIVNIMPGVYKLDETEVFGKEHGGKNGYKVVFRAANVFNRPVISGGRKIEGWEKENDVFWSAPLEGIEYVRNLYINSYPAVRARSKYKYDFLRYYKADQASSQVNGLVVSGNNFPESFEYPEDVELIFNPVWENHRLKTEDISFDEKANEYTFVLKQSILDAITSRNGDAGKRLENTGFIIENAPELLDEPGEFYYNREKGRIYYYPYKYEDLTTAETYVGETQIMMKLCGDDPENKIENIAFENLIFRYGAYDFVSRMGYMGNQSDGILNTYADENGSIAYSPQFRFEMADGVKISGCEFSCMGSAVIGMLDGVSNAEINGNLIRDVSGTAITIGHPNHHDYVDGMEVCDNIKITNNVVRRAADEFFNNCGISVYYEKNIDISHNTILDLPYTGVSAGWGWEGGLPFDCGNYNISHNRFERVMTVLGDGGHVYTLGRIYNSVISNNYFKTNYSYNYGGGVYNDAGSQEMQIFNNVFEDNVPWIEVQSPQYKTGNIRAYNNWSDTLERDRDETSSVVIEDPILVPDANWPPEAQAVIDESGVLPQYKNLVLRSELPEGRKRKMDVPKMSFTAKQPISHGKVQAEDFLPGAEIGYHKTFRPRPNNNRYRSEPVSLLLGMDNAEGFVIDSNGAGEWLKYEVMLEKDGEYFVDVRLRQNWTDANVARISIDDKIVGDVAVPKGRNLETATTGPVYLTKGRHEVKFEFLDSVYFDWIELYRMGEKDETPYQNLSTAGESPDYDEQKTVYETEAVKEKTFEDISGHWAEKTILKMKDKAIIKGMSETEFAPDEGVTGYQAALMARRAMGMSFEGAGLQDELINDGILENEYQADTPITREEFAAIFMRVFIGKNITYRVTYGKDPCKDIDEVSEQYKTYVRGAYELGLTVGDENGNFNPKSPLSRAEALTVIYRYVM